MPTGIYQRTKEMYSNRIGRKHTEETKTKISEANIGKHNIPKSEEAKRKMRENHPKGIIPKSAFKRGQTAWNKDKPAPWAKNLPQQFKKGEHYSPQTEFKKGQMPWSYRGGITPLELQIRHCFKYRQWVSDVFTGQNFTCQECRIRGGKLEAHHIKGFAEIIHENNIKTLEEALNCEELWNINNGWTFCKKCHRVKGRHIKTITNH